MTLSDTAAASTADHALQSISRLGHRVTRTRRLLVEALAASREPLSAAALHEAVGGPRSVDLVTVYRTLHWLAELGLARTVHTGGPAELYELVSDGDHTHHLHCDVCGAVRTVSTCGLDPAVADHIAREHGFVVYDHRLTFHGLCPACATGRA